MHEAENQLINVPAGVSRSLNVVGFMQIYWFLLQAAVLTFFLVRSSLLFLAGVQFILSSWQIQRGGRSQ